MPIYLYRCGECEQTCEFLQHTNDEPRVECPHCHARALHKIIAPCGIIFKGHGFYKTDNPEGAKSETTVDHKTAETAAPEVKDSAGSSADDNAHKTSDRATAPASASASDSAKPAGSTDSVSNSAKDKG